MPYPNISSINERILQGHGASGDINSLNDVVMTILKLRCINPGGTFLLALINRKLSGKTSGLRQASSLRSSNPLGILPSEKGRLCGNNNGEELHLPD
ncbi:hypothetical protein Tco_0139696 [Tanacetum coccineum]